MLCSRGKDTNETLQPYPPLSASSPTAPPAVSKAVATWGAPAWLAKAST